MSTSATTQQGALCLWCWVRVLVHRLANSPASAPLTPADTCSGFPERLQFNMAHIGETVDLLLVRACPDVGAGLLLSCHGLPIYTVMAQDCGGMQALLQYYLASYQKSDFSVRGQQNLTCSMTLLYVMLVTKQDDADFVPAFGTTTCRLFASPIDSCTSPRRPVCAADLVEASGNLALVMKLLDSVLVCIMYPVLPVKKVLLLLRISLRVSLGTPPSASDRDGSLPKATPAPGPRGSRSAGDGDAGADGAGATAGFDAPHGQHQYRSRSKRRVRGSAAPVPAVMC